MSATIRRDEDLVGGAFLGRQPQDDQGTVGGGDVSRIRAVYFDVGETLIDESTEYGTWADWLGVPRHTFSSRFGAVIAEGRDYREVFEHFRPGFDLAAEREARLRAGRGEFFDARDLYPDVRPVVHGLREHGVFVGVAGNQTLRAGRLLYDLHLDVDLIATSDDWGVAKPDIEFFRTLVSTAPYDAAEILYVGDRVDNDIRPAARAGLLTGFIKRGPWGYHYADRPESAEADYRLASLTEILDLAEIRAEAAR